MRIRDQERDPLRCGFRLHLYDCVSATCTLTLNECTAFSWEGHRCADRRRHRSAPVCLRRHRGQDADRVSCCRSFSVRSMLFVANIPGGLSNGGALARRLGVCNTRPASSLGTCPDARATCSWAFDVRVHVKNDSPRLENARDLFTRSAGVASPTPGRKLRNRESSHTMPRSHFCHSGGGLMNASTTLGVVARYNRWSTGAQAWPSYYPTP